MPLADLVYICYQHYIYIYRVPKIALLIFGKKKKKPLNSLTFSKDNPNLKLEANLQTRNPKTPIDVSM